MGTIAFAKEFATRAHEGQVRKYTGEPYIEHPIAVAHMVAERGLGKEAIIAALLHDVVEDTPVTIEEIELMFGEVIARYVWFLTKTPGFVGNREKRKAIYNKQLSEAPEEVRKIKVLDMWHNAQSIKEHDPKFYMRFRTETRLMLAALDLPIEFTAELKEFIDV